MYLQLLVLTTIYFSCSDYYISFQVEYLKKIDNCKL